MLELAGVAAFASVAGAIADAGHAMEEHEPAVAELDREPVEVTAAD